MEGSFLLKNENGIEVVVLRRGAIIQSLRVPGRDGSIADVVLGFDDEQPYKVGPHCRLGRGGGKCCCCCAAARPLVLHPPTALLQDGTSPYMGAVVGRVANRIAGGRFSLDGKEYTLARNNGPNCLHGAPPPTAGLLPPSHRSCADQGCCRGVFFAACLAMRAAAEDIAAAEPPGASHVFSFLPGVPCQRLPVAALAGGNVGYDKVEWEAAEVADERGQAVQLSYTSKDGEEASLQLRCCMGGGLGFICVVVDMWQGSGEAAETLRSACSTVCPGYLGTAPPHCAALLPALFKTVPADPRAALHTRAELDTCRCAVRLQGFPGTVAVRVRYVLTADNRLITEMRATTGASAASVAGPAAAILRRQADTLIFQPQAEVAAPGWP
jgi:hypothetical protein